MSSYAQVLDAIEAYYGRNDIWQAMYNWTGDQATAQELAKAVEQVPGVRAVRSVSGKMQYFEYVGEEYTPHVVSDLAAQSVNSNVSAATTVPASGGGGVATKVKTPVQMDTAAGAVTGMKTGVMQAGKFTVNDVLYPIAAVSAGITLGKWIDSTLYNLNPDFWDAQGMGALNPETWDSITSGGDDINSRIFNMVFGLNGDKTQPYLDQNAVAYLTGYMIQKGIFNPADPTITPPATTPTIITNSGFTIQEAVDYGLNFLQSVGNPYVVGARNFFNEPQVRNFIQTYNDQPCRVILRYQSIGINVYSGPYDVPISNLSNSYNRKAIWANLLSPDSYGNIYTNLTNVDSSDVSTWLGVKVYPNDYFGQTWVRVSTLNTTYEAGASIEGISNQDGATQFDASGISDPSDIPSILSALQTQFPGLFNDAITNTVIDPETGEEVTTTYLPVGFPQIDPENLTQPIANISTQTDTAYDPSEYPDISDAIAELISYITDTTSETPTMQPDEVTNPNPPDTGNGNTPIVTPPAGSATALWSIYNPTQAQINSFGSWLWSNNFVEQLKKIFNDPMESIISLHKVFGTPATGGTQNIAVGYINSGVNSKVVTAQYTEVDCGEVQLLEYFGNVYDYKDTSIELYLPFIGIVPLSVSDVMRSTIHIVYHIDVLTGACLADVEITRDAGAGGVLYQYSGDCAVHYPVSAASYMSVVTGILTIAGGIAGTIASHGAAAPAILGAAAGGTRLHTDISRSGSFSGNAGAMGSKVPYLIISRPQTALPDNYLDIEGIGSNKTVTLSTCNGYTRVKEIYLQGVGDATEGELNELETLLKDGVIFPITETPPNE